MTNFYLEIKIGNYIYEVIYYITFLRPFLWTMLEMVPHRTEAARPFCPALL